MIRLVCHQANEWVKHAALHSLNLSRIILLRELQRIASKPNAFDQVTKVLILPKTTFASEDKQKTLQGPDYNTDFVCV